MALDYVSSGQELNIPAGDYNAFIDAAKFARGAKKNRLPVYPPTVLDQTSTIWVENNTGSDLTAFSVVRINNSIPDPTSSTEFLDFQARIYCHGYKPNSDDDAWAITIEPIPSGMSGRALAAGICQVKINITDADHIYAASTNNDPTMLTSVADDAENISAQIVYKSVSTGEGWALVRFPFGKRGGGDTSIMTKVFQVNATATATATWPPNNNSVTEWGSAVGFSEIDLSEVQKIFVRLSVTVSAIDTDGGRVYFGFSLFDGATEKGFASLGSVTSSISDRVYIDGGYPSSGTVNSIRARCNARVGFGMGGDTTTGTVTIHEIGFLLASGLYTSMGWTAPPKYPY